MNDCLFCRLVAGEIPSERVAETEDTISFRDINPIAPEHVLVIPRMHIGSMGEVDFDRPDHAQVWSALGRAAQEIGENHANGWRLVTNIGPEGGQTVGHLHLHVMAGRRFTWPPG
ncbi:MAG: HIT domain-containing protein [Actinobacteria bacterium]|nr:HIT domain-containing protein [Acidimicrobiia bacterium]MCA1735064.1 HIT domain-containing protein [Actinomycetota bacterium]MDQ3500294.1 HIT domain-containing protein [Actinomycetota bacterium]